MNDLIARINIPLYPGKLVLIVTDDIPASSRRFYHDNDTDVETDASGMLAHLGGDCKLFLVKDDISHGVISHEVFHTTHRIMENLGEDFSCDHQEPFAYLCGYITTEVYKRLQKFGIEVKF